MTEPTKKKKWLPIENNPWLLNKYVNALGMDKSYQYCEIFGFDDDLLAFAPPAIAVMLCFPITKENEQKKSEETLHIEENGQFSPKNLYFMNQTIGNACGTIGILHSISNNTDKLKLNDGFLKDFIEATKDLAPKERATFLEKDDRIEEVHQETATDPNSVVIPGSERTNIHFICFVLKEDHIFELDGRRKYPMNRGKSTSETFLKDTVQVIKNYMNMNPGDLNFSVTILAKSE
jgi:ubiquitin carboxyl-terminal hydrolase L3